MKLAITSLFMSLAVVFTEAYLAPSASNYPYFHRAAYPRYDDNDYLRDVVQRMTKDTAPQGVHGIGDRASSSADELEKMLDYDVGLDGGSDALKASLRDQEYLKHSTLWGGGYDRAGELGFDSVGMGGPADKQQQYVNVPLKIQGNRQPELNIPEGALQGAGALPAYCNPPNPCPVGYTAEMGCLEEFENTASFSRRYQAAQDCMCDTEHMFDCPSPMRGSGGEDGMGSDGARARDEGNNAEEEMEYNDLYDKFIQETFRTNPSYQRVVAKKFNTSPRLNPFLVGEKLPIAAKKGNHVYYN